MRVVVTGGRDLDDRPLVEAALDRIANSKGISILGHGDATGLDSLAEDYCKRKGVQGQKFKAHWSMSGLAAGPIRNRAMLEGIVPEVVVAFPGGDGTASCVSIASEMGITVVRVWRDGDGKVQYKRIA